jgi:hypothetical protein
VSRRSDRSAERVELDGDEAGRGERDGAGDREGEVDDRRRVPADPDALGGGDAEGVPDGQDEELGAARDGHDDELNDEDYDEDNDEDYDDDYDDDLRPRRAPWHFKVLAVGTVIYLGYRLYQGIGWLVHHA